MLASTPAESGMPADVAARLDATLAGLVAERADTRPRHRGRAGRTPPPSPLAPGAGRRGDRLGGRLRRRRQPRRPARCPAAAPTRRPPSRDESLAEGGGTGRPRRPTRRAPRGSPRRPDATSDSGAARDGVLLTRRAVRLHERLPHRGRAAARPGRAPPLDRRARSPQEAAGFLGRCSLPDTSRGDRLAAVRLDGKRATLVVRKAVDGTHVAEVYSCADPSQLLAITEVDSDRDRDVAHAADHWAREPVACRECRRA